MSESLKQQIDRLQEIYQSELDPRGRAFVPLADAHRQLGDLDKALTVIQEGLVEHPDFASAHVVLGWVYRSREEPDDAMRSFERVLALDAENTVARAAIAELIADRGARATADGRRVVSIASLAPGADRPVVPIASLAPVVPDARAASAAAPTIAPLLEASDGDGRPVVPIAFLAPRPIVPIDSLAPSEPDVIPIASLAPGMGEDVPNDGGSSGGEIYTQTLAELYAEQGAADRAIEVYRRLIVDYPENEAFQKRLDTLEALESGAGTVVRTELNVQAGLGEVMDSLDERKTVPVESLAPDGTTG